MTLQMDLGVLDEQYIAVIMRDILVALEYLHSQGKLHRDIKGESLSFSNLYKSRQYSSVPKRRCEISRFWGVCSVV